MTDDFKQRCLDVPSWKAARRSALPLHIREFLSDQSVSNVEDIHAAHVAVGPRIAPQPDDMVASIDCQLDLECAGRVVEDWFPRVTDRIATDAPSPVRSRTGCVENTVIGEH